MTDNTQPDALRDARWYMVDKDGMATLCTDREDAEQEAKDANMAWPHTAPHRAVQLVEVGTAAAELRRQHARIVELEAQLESIGAGGVSGPLMGQPQAMPDLSALTERGAKAWAGVDAQGLREGFTAADMATASAQGFRDGVASASVNSDGSITPGTWAHLKLMMEESAWGGEIQLSDALANVDEFARASLAANAGSEPVALNHIACIEDGELRYMAGRKAPSYDCELYAMPGGKSAPPLYTHPSPPEGMVGGWIALPGALPEPGVPVLLDIGKKYPIRALWAAKHTVEAADDDTDWAEYDEATETYYCPEGWYEWNEHEEIHWAVTETPRAWEPLPPTTPAGSGKGE